MEHYQEHSKNNGLGFFEFLKTHYSLETYLDDDYEKDMSLPFKTTNVYKLGNTFHFVIPEKMEECLPLTKEIRKEKKKIDYQSVYYLLTQHKNVFQPPELISIEEISAN